MSEHYPYLIEATATDEELAEFHASVLKHYTDNPAGSNPPFLVTKGPATIFDFKRDNNG